MIGVKRKKQTALRALVASHRGAEDADSGRALRKLGRADV
jgi:hypothetical protein